MWLFDFTEKIRALRNEAVEYNLLQIAEMLDEAIMECNSANALSHLYDIIMSSLHGDALKSENVILFPPSRIKIMMLNDESINNIIQ